ncbi:hypothetical protein [Comamonas sp. 4034]
MANWQHHYNWLRPHNAIGHITPMCRLQFKNNLLIVHS